MVVHNIIAVVPATSQNSGWQYGAWRCVNMVTFWRSNPDLLHRMVAWRNILSLQQQQRSVHLYGLKRQLSLFSLLAPFHWNYLLWEIFSSHGCLIWFNPLKPELNSICYLLALLGAHHFLHVSRIRVKLLTFRLLMSYIYGAPILDVSRSHTTTQHSR